MNPYIIIVALLAVLGAGASGFKLGRDSVIAGQAREDAQIEKAIQAANTATAEAISKIKVTNKTIQNELQKEVRYETVYSSSSCANTPNGLRLVNQALTGDNPASDSKLPKVDPVSR